MELDEEIIIEYERLYDNVLSNFVKLLKLDHFSVFEQNIIKQNNIDFNTKEGLDLLNDFCNTAVFLNYIADIQLVLLKNYLKEEYNYDFSDEEVYMYADTTCVKGTDQFSMKVSYLSEEDNIRIYNDLNMLYELELRAKFDNVLGDLTISEWLANNKLTYYFTIKNLQLKNALNKLGLQDYINTDINELLNEEPIFDEKDLNDYLNYERTLS